mgnify:CR=1 FL=1
MTRHAIGPYGQAVGRNIRRLRKRAGITQGELSQRLAVSPVNATAIGDVERGDRRVDVDELMAFAHALDVPVTELLGVADPDPEASFTRAVAGLAVAVDRLAKQRSTP